jgi:hypothetical protein
MDFPPCTTSTVIPDEFEDIEQLKAYTYKGSDVGTATASTLTWNFDKNPWFDTKKYQKEIYNTLATSIHIHEQMRSKLQEYKPDVVYVFNGRHFTTRPVLRLCQESGITCYTHERASTFQNYVLRKNTLPHDLSVVQNEIESLWASGTEDKENIGSLWYENRRNRVIQSWFVFVTHQTESLLPEGFDEKKRNIVIFNSTMEEQVGMPWMVNSIYDDEVDGISRICGSLENDKDAKVYIRLHPNLAGELRNIDEGNNTQIEKIVELAKPGNNIVIIPPTSPVDSYALLDASDIAVVFGSTIGAEATYWGKPSVLAGAGAAYRGLDCTYKPETHREIIDLLRSELKPKPKIEAVKYGYWHSTYGIPYEKFKHTGVLKGEYEGKQILPGIQARFHAYLARFLEIRNKEELTAFITDLRKFWSRQ